MLAHEGHHRTPTDDGILLPKVPKRDKRLASSQGDCKPCHSCKDWKSNGVRKFGRVTNTHQPWNTELWGSGAITMVVRNLRRLQLVINNEGLIDLHKLHRFQTNLLYPVHLDYTPSDRGQANRESSECANAGQNSCMIMMLFENLFHSWSMSSLLDSSHDTQLSP